MELGRWIRLLQGVLAVIRYCRWRLRQARRVVRTMIPPTFDFQTNCARRSPGRISPDGQSAFVAEIDPKLLAYLPHQPGDAREPAAAGYTASADISRGWHDSGSAATGSFDPFTGAPADAGTAGQGSFDPFAGSGDVGQAASGSFDPYSGGNSDVGAAANASFHTGSSASSSSFDSGPSYSPSDSSYSSPSSDMSSSCSSSDY